MTTQPIQQGFDNFIKEEVSMITALNEARTQQMMDYSKKFLDKVFPLAQGSHKDVTGYMVYYKHLLAFFADGSSTGLRKPAQFVALSGHKDQPDSLVLRDDEHHVELIFNAKGELGAKDAAHLDDIQVQTTLRSVNTQTGETEAHWFSMMRSALGTALYRNEQKAFTSKDGSDYLVG